ncbi:hypothetical protein [Streptomyces sp. NPDC001221]
MSWEHRPGDGTHGVNAVNGATGAHPTGGTQPENDAPQGPPNVYHPHVETAPEYGGYADPATAHGWQNAYDETRELPKVTLDEYGAAAPAPEGPAVPASAGPGVPAPRVGSRRRARPAPRSRGPRRLLMTAGALGVVGVAAALAGSFGSGSAGGAQGGTEESARPKAARSEVPGESSSLSSSPAPAASVQPFRSVAPAGAVSASPTAAASREVPATHSANPATSPAAPTGQATSSAPPSATASPTAPDDNWHGHPGHGHGGPRHPW